MNNDISSFPGAVMAILILAIVLTIPIGVFIISRYKKALIRVCQYTQESEPESSIATRVISLYRTTEAYHRHVGKILQVLCAKG